MSEIKPVYQQRREFDEWEDIPKDTYDMRVNGKYQVRILYPAAAYEALENERDELKQSLDDLQERFNGIKFIESELRKENDSLNAEVLRLKNELIASLKDWHDMNANHEAQEARIFELEKTWTDSGKLHATLLKLGYDRGLALHIAGATDYDQLKAENEAHAKRIAGLEATLEDIADGKPRLMHDQSGCEFFCYPYNPTKKAREALFASKNGDSK